MFFVLLNLGFEHQGTKSSSRRTGGNTDGDAPGGGSWYVTTNPESTEKSAIYRHQSRRQEDAEQRSRGSQGRRTTKA